VGLLLAAAWRRAAARREQRRTLRAQQGGDSTDWGCLGSAFLLFFALGAHGLAARLLADVPLAVQRAQAEAQGRLLVPWSALEALDRLEQATPAPPRRRSEDDLRRIFQDAGQWLGEAKPHDYEERLLAHYRVRGRDGFTTVPARWGWANDGGRLGAPATLLASLVMLAWFLGLALQGEGVDLDPQRSRHPMWEWLLSHPVDPRAVFLAEMLAPLAANVFFWAAPVFWVGAYWIAYDDFGLALVAGLAVGVPLCVAAGCAGKAIEVVALLRLPPRRRGAFLGLSAWLGQALLMALVLIAVTPGFVLAIVRPVVSLGAGAGLPILAWSLGLEGSPSPWKGVLACWLLAAVVTALAVQVSARATRAGLAGAGERTADQPWLPAPAGRDPLPKDPAARKELLWIWRDRGALVQVLLVPLTVAAVQLINLRGLLPRVTEQWHLMTGAVVVFGSYFLIVLGPRSLISEGAALWIPLTWPRGLESLLKAKARLYWLVALVIASPLLLITAIRFPADAWKVALAGALFAVFGRSLAEKSVTLVGAPSSSGEPEPVPRGRRWAALLGTLTFGVGILSQQWHLVLVGVVYAALTSAAMWQNFRARLPFLFDPWSERLPPPPTLMHAMIAISALVEVQTVLSAVLAASLGADRPFLAQALGYGVSGLGVWLAMGLWLSDRGVQAGDVWSWDGREPSGPPLLPQALGAGLGLVLGAAAVGYSALVQQQPDWGQALRTASAHLAAHPAERFWLAVMAVGCAPVAEEYLFRGLLFRALDREWGGARAIWGSAAFFAIYHPPQAWPPVLLVGVVGALLFKGTRRLWPCVLLHMAYNGVVVWAG